MDVKEEAFTCWICKGEGHKAGSRACPMFLSETVKRDRLRWSFEDPMHNFLKEEEKKDKEKRVQELQSLLESSSSNEEEPQKNKRKKKKRHKDSKKKRYNGKRKHTSSDSDEELSKPRSRNTETNQKYCDMEKTFDHNRTKHRSKSEEVRKELRIKSDKNHYRSRDRNKPDDRKDKKSRSKDKSDTDDSVTCHYRIKEKSEQSEIKTKHGRETNEKSESRTLNRNNIDKHEKYYHKNEIKSELRIEMDKDRKGHHKSSNEKRNGNDYNESCANTSRTWHSHYGDWH